MAGKSVPKVKQKLDKKDLAISLAFLLPAIIITVVFVIYPVFDTVGLSFRKWNGMFGAAKQWVGLENYQKIFSDKLFWNAMINSVYFMIGGFVILMPLSFGLAMLVTSKIKGTGFFLPIPAVHPREAASSVFSDDRTACSLRSDKATPAHHSHPGTDQLFSVL